MRAVARRAGTDGFAAGEPKKARPSVAVVVPAYNEASVIEESLEAVCRRMEALSASYRWELVVVNDGSRDGTGERTEAFARAHDRVRVLHHAVNGGLGRALKTAFRQTSSDYVITLDADLSYSPGHIPKLLDRIRESGAQIVIASPYMDGGTFSKVPGLRLAMSRGANGFLSWASAGRLSTLTGMVRAYDGPFVRGIGLRSAGMDVNLEILLKAAKAGARVEEVPAELNWARERTQEGARRSGVDFLRTTLAVLLWGVRLRFARVGPSE